jgi:hypothetical protein
MIKGCFLPVPLAMACIAHRPECALVFVVFFMAVETKIRLQLVSESAAFVTVCAFGLLVLAQQRLPCLPVMIEDDFLPVFLDVASFAFLPEYIFMLVVLFVTGNARGL